MKTAVRLIAPLTAALALGLSAAASAATSPPQKIVRETILVPPGRSATLVVDCPKGYRPVAGYIVRKGLATGSTLLGPQGGQPGWIAYFHNLGSKAEAATVEVRCVKLPGVSNVVFPRRRTPVATLGPTGEREASLPAQCPRGHAPIGGGYAHFPPDGRPGDPPSLGAGIHTPDFGYVRGGLRSSVESIGVDPVAAQHTVVCIDRRTDRYRATVVRRNHPVVRVAPNGRVEIDWSCRRREVAAGMGWLTANDARVQVDPEGWTGARTFEMAILNRSNTAQEVTAQGLCLTAEVM